MRGNIEVAGLPATAGTPALKDYVPEKDAPVAAKLRAAGAIIIGKTNMHELAFGVSGYNAAFKTGTNLASATPMIRRGSPAARRRARRGDRRADRPAGLGTDTGGSVRVPCALNGCASLRPTVGRYPQAGHRADLPYPRHRRADGDDVADVALLDRVIAGGGALAAADLKAFASAS